MTPPILPAVTIFQSTLSVRRATPENGIVERGGMISIHALREESDQSYRSNPFLTCISIHALREESDVYVAVIFQAFSHFNPRSP